MDDTVLLSTYIPNKLAKYGIKVFALADSTMFYISNFEIYCGKQRPGPLEGSNNSTDIVLRLIKPFDYKNSNLTTDNGNTSFPLSKMLLEKKIILLGTLKKRDPTNLGVISTYSLLSRKQLGCHFAPKK